MGQCGSNEVPENPTLTPEDVETVTTTWKAVYSEWEAKHGLAFFYRLFTRYKGTKDFFQQFNKLDDSKLMSSEELRAHTVVFGSGMDSFVQNLTNTEKLVQLVQKMTDSHTARGITLDYFKSSTAELLNYLTEQLKPNKEQKKSWMKVVAILNSIITERCNQKS